MAKIGNIIRFRISQVYNIKFLGPMRVTRGTIKTASSVVKGNRDIRIPTRSAGIPIVRANRTIAGPTIHCQDITLKEVKARYFRGAVFNSITARTMGILRIRDNKCIY